MSWAILLSLGVHLVLLAAFVFWPAGKSSRRQFFAPVYQVRLVGPPRSAPAVAPKPAARTAPRPKPVARPKPAPKPAPKPKEAIAVKPTPKAKRLKRTKPKPKAPDAAKLLDKKIRRLREKVRQERKVESALDRLRSKVAARGPSRQGSYASGGSSAGGDKLSLRFQIYYTQIWERIRRQWVLPEALVKDARGLTAVVVMRIRRDGSLEKVWLEQSSGNRRFDASALRAAERAAPYPPLPRGMRQSVHEVGVRFRPEDVS